MEKSNLYSLDELNKLNKSISLGRELESDEDREYYRYFNLTLAKALVMDFNKGAKELANIILAMDF